MGAKYIGGDDASKRAAILLVISPEKRKEIVKYLTKKVETMVAYFLYLPVGDVYDSLCMGIATVRVMRFPIMDLS